MEVPGSNPGPSILGFFAGEEAFVFVEFFGVFFVFGSLKIYIGGWGIGFGGCYVWG